MDFVGAELALKAMGEETRLKILSYLTLDAFCVCELVELLEMSQPSISQHLRRLREANLILEEKRGRWVFYSLNQAHELYTLLLHLISLLPSKKSSIDSFIVAGKRVLCD